MHIRLCGASLALGNDGALCKCSPELFVWSPFTPSILPRSEYKFSTPLTVASRQQADICHLDMCNAEMEPGGVTQPGDHTPGTRRLTTDNGCIMILGPIFGHVASDTDLWWCLLTSDNDTCAGSREIRSPMSEEKLWHYTVGGWPLIGQLDSEKPSDRLLWIASSSRMFAISDRPQYLVPGNQHCSVVSGSGLWLVRPYQCRLLIGQWCSIRTRVSAKDVPSPRHQMLARAPVFLCPNTSTRKNYTKWFPSRPEPSHWHSTLPSCPRNCNTAGLMK